MHAFYGTVGGGACQTRTHASCHTTLVAMRISGKAASLLLLALLLVNLVEGKRKTPGRNKQKPKQKPKPKPKPKPLVRSYNVSSLEEGIGSCPGKYIFEEGDSMQLTSPNYPKPYPNRYNCQWGLEAHGCQFNIECQDLFTRPVCSGGSLTLYLLCLMISY